MPATEFELVTSSRSLPAVEVLSGDVVDDEEAIKIFIDSYSRKSVHTVRSYKKECYRFLLWLKATRDSTPAMLPSVSVKDANSYVNFLSNPRPFSASFLKSHGWDHQPFRKGLESESVKHCITVLHKMFSALREMRTAGNLPYCMFNPFKLAQDGIGGGDQDDEIEEALSSAEWDAVQAVVEELPQRRLET